MDLLREAETRRTKFRSIAQKARENPGEVFTSLAHYLTEEYLLASFSKLRRSAATGIDKVSCQDYEKHLTENIENLHQRLKAQRYRATEIGRAWIDKVIRPLLNGKIFIIRYADDFILGFTHFWTKSQQGYKVIKRRTSKKKMQKAIQNLRESCKENRHLKLKDQYKLLSSKRGGRRSNPPSYLN